MNYYGIWISFSDRSNLFYDPGARQLVRLPEGTPMPPEFFFLSGRLAEHQMEVMKLTAKHCRAHVPDYHLSEIRPKDPDWESIYAYRNPPLYPGGPPAATEEDLPE
jgi:hypothetical protein